MMIQDRSTLHYSEFNVTAEVKNGLDWKTGKVSISQALKNGERIKLLTSDGTHGFKVERVQWVNSNLPTAMQELFCNQDLTFTKMVSHEPASHRKGYHAVSNRLLTRTLEDIKKIFHTEINYQKSPEYAEAQKVAEEAKAAHEAKRAKYEDLLHQQAEFEQLRAEFGCAV